MERNISTLEYNNSSVYEFLNNPFTYYFGSPDLNLPPITIDDRPCPHKRALSTPDLLPDTISVASKNYVGNLTTPYDSSDFLPSGDLNTLRVIREYGPYLQRVKIGYQCSKHDGKICYKNIRLYFSTCSDKNKIFYYSCGISSINSETRNLFL